jgi:hypothetical protein
MALSMQILMLTDEASLPRIDVNRREAPLPSDLRASYNEWRRHVSSRLENGEHSVPSTFDYTNLASRTTLRALCGCN